LAEIIMKAIGHSSTSTKGVMGLWENLINKFGNEVAVLIDADITEIYDLTDERRGIWQVRTFSLGVRSQDISLYAYCKGSG
jgi:PHP family Zn ribbon phosphoesterase